jgi:hypothetical protein
LCLIFSFLFPRAHFLSFRARQIATNVRPFVKLPALASVTEGASPDMTRWLQTLAICRWTKQRKPSKAKGGPPPAASKGQLFAVLKGAA